MNQRAKSFDLIEEKNAPFSRTTLWRLRNRRVNPLKCFKVGRRIYYSRRHIEEFLRNSEEIRPGAIAQRADWSAGK
jgi:hypothetical protein